MILEAIQEQLSETLQSRALLLFGHAVDRVELRKLSQISTADLASSLPRKLATTLHREPGEIAERLAAGMHLPPLVQSVSVAEEETLHFRLDRGAFTAEHSRTVMAPRPSSAKRVTTPHPEIAFNPAATLGDLRRSVLSETLVRFSDWLGHASETRAEPWLSCADVALSPATEKTLGKEPARVTAGDLLQALQGKAVAVLPESDSSAGREIAVAALRYAMLRPGREEVLVFDLDEALRRDDDCGPFLQDSVMRVRERFLSLAESGVRIPLDDRAFDDLTLIQGLTDEMWELVWLSAGIPGAIERTAGSLEPSIATVALAGMAARYRHFEGRFPLLKELAVAERQRRALCAELVRRTMARTMALLGIPVPEGLSNLQGLLH